MSLWTIKVDINLNNLYIPYTYLRVNLETLQTLMYVIQNPRRIACGTAVSNLSVAYLISVLSLLLSNLLKIFIIFMNAFYVCV